jgi:prevent-host-death family protein
VTIVLNPRKAKTMKSQPAHNKALPKNQIGAGQFKTHCLQLIDQVNQTHKPLIITKHGKPLVTLMPFNEKSNSLYGSMKGTVIIHGDIVQSTGEIWDADK